MPKQSSGLPFTISKRENQNEIVFAVRFRNPITNKFTIKRTIHAPTKEKATIEAWNIYNSEYSKISEDLEQKEDVNKLLNTLNLQQITDFLNQLQDRGILSSFTLTQSKQDIKASDYLTKFWNWNESEYIKDLLASKKSIHKKYCNENLKFVKKYWSPILKEKKINEIQLDDLRNLKKSLYDLDLATSSKNHILKSGIIAIKYAIANEQCQMRLIDNKIPKDIYFSNNYTKREILTLEVAMSLFSQSWENPMAELANKLAMVTGMRKGEILGLRRQDLGENCIYVRHSWSNFEGLKTTKTNEERIAVIPFTQIMNELKELASLNPYLKSPEDLTGFIFWSTLPNKPIDEKVLIKNFRKELSKYVGEIEAKKYCFHSWRHFFVKNMKNKIADSVLQSQTGHKTLEMLNHYANHTDSSDRLLLGNEILTVFNDIMAESKETIFNSKQLYQQMNKHGTISKMNSVYCQSLEEQQ